MGPLISYSVLLLTTLLFLGTALYGDFKYIQQHVSKGSVVKPTRTLLIAGSMYLSITTSIFVFYVVYCVYMISAVCAGDNLSALPTPHALETFSTFDRIKDALYVAQMYGLWCMLFTRINYVFRSSVYRLSNCT